MKKLKDLDKNINIQNIKVRLPKHIFENSSLPLYKLENVPVYLIGWMMGDFFVKIDITSDQVYPMFWNSVPEDILEWEIED